VFRIGARKYRPSRYEGDVNDASIIGRGSNGQDFGAKHISTMQHIGLGDVDGGKGETEEQSMCGAKKEGEEAGTGVLPSSVPGASDVDAGQDNKVVVAETEPGQEGHGAAEEDRASGDAAMEEGEEAGTVAEADTESDDCIEASKDIVASPSIAGMAPAALPLGDESVAPLEKRVVQSASDSQRNCGKILTPGRSVIIGSRIVTSPSQMGEISRARESVFAAIAGVTAAVGEQQAGKAGVSVAMEEEQGEAQGKPAADGAAIDGEPAAVGGKSDLKRPLPAQSSAGSSKIQKISLVQL